LKTKQAKVLNLAVGKRDSSVSIVSGHWLNVRAIGVGFLTVRSLMSLQILSFHQLFGCGINCGRWCRVFLCWVTFISAQVLGFSSVVSRASRAHCLEIRLTSYPAAG